MLVYKMKERDENDGENMIYWIDLSYRLLRRSRTKKMREEEGYRKTSKDINGKKMRKLKR